jgi:hypothetical protein
LEHSIDRTVRPCLLPTCAATSYQLVREGTCCIGRKEESGKKKLRLCFQQDTFMRGAILSPFLFLLDHTQRNYQTRYTGSKPGALRGSARSGLKELGKEIKRKKMMVVSPCGAAGAVVSPFGAAGAVVSPCGGTPTPPPNPGAWNIQSIVQCAHACSPLVQLPATSWSEKKLVALEEKKNQEKKRKHRLRFQQDTS